jgi:lysophospholipase L1-like esterase
MKPKKFWRGMFFAALFLALVSVTLNIVLYSQLKRYYTYVYAIELDPLGLEYYRDAQALPAVEGAQTIVFFGDSRAAQWTEPTLQGFTFTNRGIGNQTTAQVLNRFDEHIVHLQPDVIILQVGINDLKTIPLFPGRKAEIISNCKDNIGRIVEKSLEAGSVVVLTTIFPIGEIPLQRRLVWSNDIEEARVEVNEYIRRLAAENVLIFDSAALLSDSHGTIKPEYGYDTLHLNPVGYDVLNLELIKLLETTRNAAR